MGIMDKIWSEMYEAAKAVLRERRISEYVTCGEVAAAVRSKSGKIYTGVNVENATYGAAICAERNAIFRAAAEGERRLLALAVTGGPKGEIEDEYCAPCGICRQVMREFADPESMLVISAKSPDDYREYTLAELLPESFGPEFLG